MTTFYLTNTNPASDNNGGTSLTVRSTFADAIVNTTAGLTKVTSQLANGTWSSADIGHGIKVGSVWRVITAFTANTTVAIGTTNTSAAITSAGLFTAGMVGQKITGSNIPANTVIQAVTNANSATMSGNAGATASITASLHSMFTCGTGNVDFAATFGQTATVGGPWATFGGAPFATNSPVVGGDTIWVAPGHYRESGVTFNLTSPASLVDFKGDVTGINTNSDPGEVRLSLAGFTDFGAGGTSSAAVNYNSKSNIAFSNMVWASAGAAMITNLAGLSHTWTDMAFYLNGGVLFSNTFTASTVVNHVWDRCTFVIMNSSNPLFTATFPTNGTADYDANITFKNCLAFTTAGASAFCSVGASGALAFKGGGINIYSCTLMCSSPVVSTSSANVATSFPGVEIYDSIIMSNSIAVNANTVGQIVEDYNFFQGTRTNVTAGTHSQSSNSSHIPMFHFGQERTWGGAPKHFGTPARDNQLLTAAGTSANAQTVDIYNRPRPSGVGRRVTTGTATSGAAQTLTDTAATWAGSLNGATIKLTGGTGSGQVKTIKSNTSTVLTLYSNWTTTPDATSTYIIYFGNVAEGATATSGSTTTIVVSNATWHVNQWAGFVAEITSGTGSGQTTTVTSNTATTLTVATMGVGANNTSVFKLYRETSEDVVGQTYGAIEGHDTARKETTVTDAGGVGWVLYGSADQDLKIPVNASATNITIKARYDSDHGTTNKPQATLIAHTGIGVSTQTVTMTSAADTWETLTLSSFTPTAKGVVTVRLRARSAKPTGRAYFDTVTIT